MAYTKTNWVNDSVPAINASNLNKIEQGIYDNSFESGSNSYGSYIKFADGTMITRRITNTINVNINNSWGGIYYGIIDDYYIFPSEFVEPPCVIWDILPASGTGCFKVHYEQPIITNTKIQNISVGRPTSSTDVSIKLYIIAIGRWK